MKSKIKIIVTLTTIPERINKIKEVLLSIKNQSVEINKLYINIPQNYIIPPSIYEFIPEIEIIRVEEDYGPITKLLPLIDLIDIKEDIWVLTIDDDIIYNNNHIYNLINSIEKYNTNKMIVYGYIGLNITNIKNSYEDKYKFSSINNESEVSILEGYGTILYHRSVFKDDFKIY
jgi:hypothetical protein